MEKTFHSFVWCEQVLYSTVSVQIPIIKLATFLVFQRLYISRHHFGGTLWIPAPQTEAESHGLHRPAAGGPGEDLPEDSLPRCGDERAAGHVHQPAWSQSPGTDPLGVCQWGCFKEHSRAPRELTAPLTFQDSCSGSKDFGAVKLSKPGAGRLSKVTHLLKKLLIQAHIF